MNCELCQNKCEECNMNDVKDLQTVLCKFSDMLIGADMKLPKCPDADSCTLDGMSDLCKKFKRPGVIIDSWSFHGSDSTKPVDMEAALNVVKATKDRLLAMKNSPEKYLRRKYAKLHTGGTQDVLNYNESRKWFNMQVEESQFPYILQETTIDQYNAYSSADMEDEVVPEGPVVTKSQKAESAHRRYVEKELAKTTLSNDEVDFLREQLLRKREVNSKILSREEIITQNVEQTTLTPIEKEFLKNHLIKGVA